MELSKLPQKAMGIENVYTLVLDLDETLIHYEIEEGVEDAEEEPGYYLIRPGACRFITEMSEYFEIVIFTAAMPSVSTYLYFILTLLFLL